MPHILIVEDEAVIRGSIKRLLVRSGYQVSEADSVKSALAYGALNQFDLVLSDLRLKGGAEGTELISYCTETAVLIMTSYASMKTAVEALQAGAADYIAKPFDNQDLLDTIAKHVRNNHEAKASGKPLGGMLGDSTAMKVLFKNILKIADTDATVLINGETGTGKELIATALHANNARANGPLISVNCAAIPESLIEAELFGHVKGAFTGADTNHQGLIASAHNGTLFLDEIGELPLLAQARLLRVLQESEVRQVGAIQSQKIDIRVVAATHRNLRKLVAEGLFREDLYYRLNIFNITAPPLRERGKDKINLAKIFMDKYANKFQRPIPILSAEATVAIDRYRWPGNVRELENAMQRAVVLCEPGKEVSSYTMGIDQIPDDLEIETDIKEVEELAIDLSTDIEEGTDLSDYFLRFVLENQDKMSETLLAKKLGVSRKCLWERRQKLGIPRQKSTVKPVN